MTTPRWLRQQRRRPQVDAEQALEDVAKELWRIERSVAAISRASTTTDARLDRLTSLTRDLAATTRDLAPADVDEGRSWSWSIGFR